MIRTAALFQDNLILQRGKPIPVWGTADPGAHLSVAIQGQTAQGTADAQGSWRVVLLPLSASDAETMTITARGEEPAQGTKAGPAEPEEPGAAEVLRLQNVAVGEVWIAGGQSNMEFWMRYEAHRAGEGQACPNPRLRFYDIPKVCYDGQLEEFDYRRMGVWRTATEADLDYFSAAAYYFQKELAADLAIPVGIIGCNWGGTIAAAWMDPETFERIGGPWLDWFEQVPEYQDLESYLAAQHGKPVNDHGNPFGDYFLEGVLPRTMDTREAFRFIGSLPADTAAIFRDYMGNPQPQSVPGSLWEHMVQAAAPFPVRGVLWYQGEGDDEFGLPEHYAVMLTGLIGDWRRLWKDESMPFLIVQIPGFSSWLLDPPGNNLTEIRRCQETVCDTVPDTWLCSAGDAGAETDAHPKDKTAIGHRLALLARNHIYGENILSDAPRVIGAEVETIADSAAEETPGKNIPGDNSKKNKLRIIVTFSNAGDGLHIEGDRVNALEISDGEIDYDFEAAAEGDRLILTIAESVSSMNDVYAGHSADSAKNGHTAGSGNSGGFEQQLTVSFAQTSWYCVNLYNSAGIPAIPFRFTL